ncbi:choice-of-anchor L domain-containing protein [Chryseobacterium sp. P1-3]|uniref:choice-of-anchor L domain-containing protein n=1 Tax=Chryseobacterium sp. (strain P1-3) TaxID=1517683 RepID=UPI000AAF9324|nr:choice-of-anchor L domain-containing protein [Chryseobacterium sp. P1-3]
MLNYRVKSYFFLFAFLLISISAFSQTAPDRRMSKKVKPSAASLRAGAFIDVNVTPYVGSTYTAEQLVKNILINGGTNCTTANVTNVTVSPNHAVGDNDRFWGYFNKGTASFPFTDGIVLTTGYARQAGNSYVGLLSGQVGTGSDPDLVTATNPPYALLDAVALEFDFVPNSTQVKFNYIFASEEYDADYPCSGCFCPSLKESGRSYVYQSCCVTQWCRPGKCYKYCTCRKRI